MRALLTAVVLAIVVAGPVLASPTQCSTRIDGEEVTIFFNTDDPTFSSLRERFWRRGNECPGAVVITYMMPDLTAEEREIFCANYDPKTRSHSQPAHGRRDARGRCAEPSRTCELVNATRDEVKTLTGLSQSGDGRSRFSALVSTLTHSSGALILSGNAATLTGFLGNAGTLAGTVASSPALLTGAAVSVVVIGGAVYLCAD